MGKDKRRMLGLMVACTLLGTTPAIALPATIGQAQPPIIRPTGNPADLPINRIIGQTFVFLEKRRSEQRQGYTGFTINGAQANSPELATGSGAPRYEAFVGKAMRAVSVFPHPERPNEYTITFSDPDTGLQVVGSTFNQALRDLAPAEDLRQARERWVGRTLYTKSRWLETYNADQDWFGRIALQMSEPLKVVDVVLGTDSNRPLWVIVERGNGERGFFATAYSWTNVYADWWTMGRPWENKLAELNPKEAYFANNEGSEQRLVRINRTADQQRNR